MTQSIRLGWICAWLLMAWLGHSVVEAKSCQVVSRGKELKALMQDSHVLISLQTRQLDVDDEDDVDEDDAATGFDADYQDLCKRLEETPEARVEDMIVAVVTDSNLKRKVLEDSQFAPMSFPAQWMHRIGLRSLLLSVQSKTSIPPVYPEYILYTKGSTTKDGLRYPPEESKSTEDISSFVSMILQRKKLGNFVYSLSTFDVIAAQIMKYDDEDLKGWKGWFWVEILGRMTEALLKPTWFAAATLGTPPALEQELIQLYMKSARKVRAEGPGVATKQVERLEGMLQKEDNSIQPLQREQLSQRLYTWKKFTEPVDFSDDEWWALVSRLGIHLLSLTALLILLPWAFLGSPEDEEQEDEEEWAEEPEENLEPVEEETEDVEPEEVPSTEDVPSQAEPKMTKQEKRALAIQRAKESMAADKRKVEQVKQKREQGTPTETTAFSEDELNKKTVVELKEMLREQGLRLTGKKTELVARLLEHTT